MVHLKKRLVGSRYSSASVKFRHGTRWSGLSRASARGTAEAFLFL
ncbi:unnamed protein product [Chondrus crispus]|uniref:Uncharacterized protein n=1 Tax=Chondrus crispus TaxID=2769 RepID=S0F307_CHOCR|nr:unnamed protein product [Chondrus crispus]CDF77566.1 unnamed protein product [Chondrus crispus]|eukprot:XP_005717350.1 unnamed protein product [Chondrus crispus]